MVRFLDGWHEVKVGVAAGCVDGQLIERSYLGRRLSAEGFGPLLAAEAARRRALDVAARKGEVTRRGVYVLREVAVLGDGAVWIGKLAEEHFRERVAIVDFYHASEHLWGVANALHGVGRLAAERWADTQAKALHDAGAGPVREALAAAARKITAPFSSSGSPARRSGVFSSM